MRNLVTQGTCLQWRCLASAVSGHCPPSQVAAGHALVHRPLHASLSPIPYCRPLGAIPASQWCPLPSVPPATSAPRTLSPPPACPPIYRGHRHYRRDRRDLPISAYIGVIGGPPIGVIGTIGVIGGSPIGVIGGPPIGVIGTIGVYRCDRRYRWLSSSSALSAVPWARPHHPPVFQLPRTPKIQNVPHLDAGRLQIVQQLRLVYGQDLAAGLQFQ